MIISSANVGGDTDTEVEVREYHDHIEVRMLTERVDPRPVWVWVDGVQVRP
ncbi:hypothetical protein [Curtobacterium sp. SORGH_AS_0776]|uniref:hypothetical protein n=1 Tax=Curtobacterium sp. SORGH_AS_0776 TaxID=3041798 RepID=UPI002856B2B0|nr:hypothetical protein [Curtobacterium sp. SORGH_AS_0776]MDR6172621.1 hypothetical protein [Curtobacterium sp. SORGH_AS_0776]